MTGRLRADQLLVSRGLFESRARARAAIEAGLVFADGAQVRKAAQMLPLGALLEAESPYPYVSRGGVKLAHALEHFRFNPAGKICLDIGASTGGFTDVLLRAGARRVYAVDVGTNQLHSSLLDRPEIIRLENTDARALDRAIVREAAQVITIDVSFISLKLIFPCLGKIAAPKCMLVALIKPQFEAGKKLVKKGLVRDEVVHNAVCNEVVETAEKHGWHVAGVITSPIEGGDGNREFLLGASLP